MTEFCLLTAIFLLEVWTNTKKYKKITSIPKEIDAKQNLEQIWGTYLGRVIYEQQLWTNHLQKKNFGSWHVLESRDEKIWIFILNWW